MAQIDVNTLDTNIANFKLPRFYTIQEGKALIPSQVVIVYKLNDTVDPETATNLPQLKVTATGLDGSQHQTDPVDLDQVDSPALQIIDINGAGETAHLDIEIENSYMLNELFSVDVIFSNQATITEESPDYGNDSGV